MIELKLSRIEDIPLIVTMENDVETAPYIMPYEHDKHQYEMTNSGIVYLSIFEGALLVGFIILSLEPHDSIEFRRIVIAVKGRGIGQLAMHKMEAYCQSVLKAQRIWLDVFESNLRGLYLYKKLGYHQFKQKNIDGKVLLFFEKIILPIGKG
ncbi:GNAT family N-acetyltransferase [uncultured Shewanella sp.]|uniref:GNAT family N-acetyltransferase n=1 Tax=uncultured Shewanella sp. TaxID=173975 RepID=UPI00260ECC6F|nr:GNAT family N-acetyltransferase [uncultured Shewanella sp.]